jgi:hypothetical protein
MSDLLLPAEGLARLTGAGHLIGRPHSPVLHLARVTPAQVTPTGRLRRGTRPLCGQTARSWPATLIDGRPLCAHCTRTLERTSSSLFHPDLLTEQLLTDTIRTARTPEVLTAVVTLLCHAKPGILGRLAPLVHEHRNRLGLDALRTITLPPQRPRRGLSRPGWYIEAAS